MLQGIATSVKHGWGVSSNIQSWLSFFFFSFLFSFFSWMLDETSILEQQEQSKIKLIVGNQFAFAL